MVTAAEKFIYVGRALFVNSIYFACLRIPEQAGKTRTCKLRMSKLSPWE